MIREYWEYSDNESVAFDPNMIKFKPTGAFYKDMADYCDLAGLHIHPSFDKPKKVLIDISIARKYSSGRWISGRIARET